MQLNSSHSTSCTDSDVSTPGDHLSSSVSLMHQHHLQQQQQQQQHTARQHPFQQQLHQSHPHHVTYGGHSIMGSAGHSMIYAGGPTSHMSPCSIPTLGGGLQRASDMDLAAAAAAAAAAASFSPCASARHQPFGVQQSTMGAHRVGIVGGSGLGLSGYYDVRQSHHLGPYDATDLLWWLIACINVVPVYHSSMHQIRLCQKKSWNSWKVAARYNWILQADKRKCGINEYIFIITSAKRHSVSWMKR